MHNRKQTMTRVLLSGFAPFGGSQSNPSHLIVERLHGEMVGGAQIIGLTLPVQMGEDAAQLMAAIAEHKPSLVLSLGLAAGTPCLDLERFAVNLRFTGEVNPDEPVPADLPQSCVIADGFAALMATIDTERVARAIRAAGVPARAHGYAGAYACNHILYQTLHCAMQWNLAYRAGFIHLPLSSAQVIEENKLHLPSLPLDLMTAGVRAAIEEVLSNAH